MRVEHVLVDLGNNFGIEFTTIDLAVSILHSARDVVSWNLYSVFGRGSIGVFLDTAPGRLQEVFPGLENFVFILDPDLKRTN